MKHYRTIFLCIAASVTTFDTTGADDDNFKIVIEPIWQDLERDQSKSEQFGGKWILAGSITFEKKAKESVNLHRLYLRWNGLQIENLCGSLYQKTPDKEFRPIEANLICDGVWSKTKQILMLTFDEQKTLGLRNIFYLVLTIPKEIEYTIRQGSFDIENYTLPEPFRPNKPEDRLSLSLDAIGSVTIYKTPAHH